MNYGKPRPASRYTGEHLGWALLFLAALGWPGCSSSKPEPAPATGSPQAKPDAPRTATGSSEAMPTGEGKQVTAQGVLETMVATYRQATSYADGGQLRLQGQVGDQKLDNQSEFLVAFVRPNKLLLRSHQGILVADGKQISAFIKDIPGQVVQRPAPPQLGMGALFADAVLNTALTDAPPQTAAIFPPPLVLLLAKDPMKTLLYRAEAVELLPSDKVGDRLCYRIRVGRVDGDTVYWIDQERHVLRRVDYATEGLRQAIASGPVQNLALVAEFQAAELGAEVDPKAFQFEVPPGAHVSPVFTPPDLERIGKRVADFEFTDMDGKPVTPKTLAGKVAVLDFWATTCIPCRDSMPELQDVYRDYKGNDKVRFLAVSTDEPSVENKKLEETLRGWKAEIPIVRAGASTASALKIMAVPTTIVLDGEGVVQHVQTGAQPGGTVSMAAKLRQLLDGTDVAKQTLKQYEDFRKNYLATIEQWAAADVFAAPPGVQLTTVVAPKSEPRALKLGPLWNSKEVKAPGNLLAIDDGGKLRILALDMGNTVVELGPDGRLLATHSLKIPADRPLAALRTALTPEGKRVYVGFNGMLPQLYVFDEKLQLTVTFPKDEENPRMGIADVELARLTGDGPLAMLVGYWGIAGVQAVSLDGSRLWANKSIVEVSRVAVLGPDADGKRSLLCTNIGSDGGSLVLIDSQGQRRGERRVKDRTIAWILGAELTGDDKPEICALAPDPQGNVTALGLDAEGNELWAYPLPRGMHETAVERAVTGNLFADGPGQWFLPGADGSIHILTADGKLLDQFAYGDRISGLAVAKVDGKPVLLVSTPQAVEAWRMEPLGKR